MYPHRPLMWASAATVIFAVVCTAGHSPWRHEIRFSHEHGKPFFEELLSRQVMGPSQLPAGPFAILPDTNGQYAYSGPIADGGRSWQDGFAKARALIKQMTIPERVNVTTGYSGACVGYTGEVPRLGLGALCLQDSPTGVRPARRVSQFPAGVTVAATWDRELIAARAEAIADEHANKGVNIMLGPVTGGPLGRNPRNGRNWEGWSPDEYLSGVASYISVKHSQKNGLMACAKHYLLYEQETFRDQYNTTEAYSVFPPNQQLPISSNADDRTTHELYLWSFSEAIRAGTATIMCSYNNINGTHSCANDYSLNKLLKEELNFQGAVISDWGGTWDTPMSAVGGLDVSMPGAASDNRYGNFFGQELIDLVTNGSVPEARLNDMVLRTLGPAMHFQDLKGWPKPTFDVRDLTLPTNNVRRDHHKVIRQIGEDSVTLLKNVRGDGRGLPLRSLQELGSVAVIGQDAGPNLRGASSCGQDGTCAPWGTNNGTATLGGGSGWSFPPYTIDPLAAISNYVRFAGPDVNSHLDNWDLPAAASQAGLSEAALVFVNAYATEGRDRENLTLWRNGDALIQAVAAVNNNTVVIMHVPGPVLMEEWFDHPNVTAVVMAYLPGQEGGNSLPPILWGEKSPSGKLPFTMAKLESDWPPNTTVADPVIAPQADFAEGLLIDYKWFDAHNITPRVEFGFGLSYSTFSYGQLRLRDAFEADGTAAQLTNERYKHHPGEPSGNSLYDVLMALDVDITNTGDMDAAEVAQLYLTLPSYTLSPPRLLRGFGKLLIPRGQTRTITFKLRRKDVSVWDTHSQEWEIPSGDLILTVGASSRVLYSSVTKRYR